MPLMLGAAWLILPTYEEAENVEAIVGAARDVLARCCGADGFRILVVDDDSPDGTGALADAVAERHPEVEVLPRPRREGLGRASLAGCARAGARRGLRLRDG